MFDTVRYMARTPRTIELSSISVRVPLEVRTWLDERMKETGRQSLNEVVNDLVEDARSWYRLPKPMIDALDRDRKSSKVKDFREYLVSLLLERYVALQKA
jgi:Arc/MetJ-type ribon-helix-helix transcriptional regulator